MKNLAHSPFHGPSPLEIMKASIKPLQLFEDRSDAACRVVVKRMREEHRYSLREFELPRRCKTYA